MLELTTVKPAEDKSIIMYLCTIFYSSFGHRCSTLILFSISTMLLITVYLKLINEDKDSDSETDSQFV